MRNLIEPWLYGILCIGVISLHSLWNEKILAITLQSRHCYPCFIMSKLRILKVWLLAKACFQHSPALPGQDPNTAPSKCQASVVFSPRALAFKGMMVRTWVSDSSVRGHSFLLHRERVFPQGMGDRAAIHEFV